MKTSTTALAEAGKPVACASGGALAALTHREVTEHQTHGALQRDLGASGAGSSAALLEDARGFMRPYLAVLPPKLLAPGGPSEHSSAASAVATHGKGLSGRCQLQGCNIEMGWNLHQLRASHAGPVFTNRCLNPPRGAALPSPAHPWLWPWLCPCCPPAPQAAPRPWPSPRPVTLWSHQNGHHFWVLKPHLHKYHSHCAKPHFKIEAYCNIAIVKLPALVFINMVTTDSWLPNFTTNQNSYQYVHEIKSTIAYHLKFLLKS